jgi:hypothetical protein
VGAFGGGIGYEGIGQLTIRRCTITQNSAPDGGGIYAGRFDGSVQITDCTIADNVADGPGASGAGVLCMGWDANTRVSYCTITGNRAIDENASGAGVECLYSGAHITNCTISGNAAIGEHASAGGALFCSWGRPARIVNCLITRNAADAYAGALATAADTDLKVTNCTISANSAAAGRALGCAPEWIPGSAQLTNCILWNGGDEVRLDNDSTVTIGYSDVQGGWEGFSNIDADPLFVDPDNGDYHLSPGSPCIDAGCNWSVPADFADLDDDGDTTEITPLDLDGEGRFFDDPDTPDTGGGCPPIVDMGAYEFGGTGPQPCPGDLDCDRQQVDEADLSILLGAWGDPPAGDLNCDGQTDESDLGILLANWGNVCP